MKVKLPEFNQKEVIDLSKVDLEKGLLIGYVNGNPECVFIKNENYFCYLFASYQKYDIGCQDTLSKIVEDFVKRWKGNLVTLEYFPTHE